MHFVTILSLLNFSRSPTLNDNVTKQDSNELIVASNITQYSSNEFLSLDELRNTATVEDEDESM